MGPPPFAPLESSFTESADKTGKTRFSKKKKLGLLTTNKEEKISKMKEPFLQCEETLESNEFYRNRQRSLPSPVHFFLTLLD